MDNYYYDGTKLLSMKDINGNKPEVFICVGNRTAGKTTYFMRMAFNRWIKKKKKFAILYRFNYELDDCAENIFKDLRTLFFPEYILESEPRSRATYHELFLNHESCGYAITLNNADIIKKKSHLFSDVDLIIFDEFQSENNHYCVDEITKFISVHTSIARGDHKLVRYVPVVMISNAVSLINPYFAELGISERLNNETKFLKGDGFVLEQAYNENAANAQKESGFNKAFSGNKYVAYSSQNIYLNDNMSFIEKPTGKSKYLCTLKYDGTDYAIREYPEIGIVYADTSVDSSAINKIAVTTSDHQINYIMLKKNDFILSNLRFLFERGCFRFKNLKCKEVVLKALSYKS